MSDTPLGAELAKIEQIFEAALGIADPAARRAYVAAATSGESALEREILSLLAADAAGAELFGEFAEGAFRDDPTAGLSGSRLGNFAVGAEIGRGGMATVYAGRRVDGELEQEVAIKVLRLSGEELRARFRAERQTLVGLRHPFIVAPLDAGTTPGGQPYLVLEKVDGRPLLDFCGERQLGLEARLELFEKVCLAVGHAHRRLVVHRDLKPANILVDREGQPRLLDFGVAKLLGPAAGDEPEAASAGGDLTGAAGAPFTPRYASPEQIGGEPAATTSDVYSLGVVLFELLTLEAADDPAEAPSAAVRARSRLAPGSREDLARRLEGDLDAVAAKARAADPARRYLSADALREDLERRRRHLPLLAREPRGAYLLGRFLRRHRAGLAVAAGLAIALLAAAILARRAEERAVASEAIAWRAHAEAAWASQTLGRLLADLAAPGELSGDRLAGDSLAGARSDAAAALAGTERLLEQAGDQAPEAEARLRHALALVYARIGRRAEAIAHARRAAELASATRGLGPEDLEANLKLLAELGGEE